MIAVTTDDGRLVWSIKKNIAALKSISIEKGRAFHQSGSASTEVQSKKQEVVEIEQELKDHRASASELQTFSRETITKCSETWKVTESLMTRLRSAPKKS